MLRSISYRGTTVRSGAKATVKPLTSLGFKKTFMLGLIGMSEETYKEFENKRLILKEFYLDLQQNKFAFVHTEGNKKVIECFHLDMLNIESEPREVTGYKKVVSRFVKSTKGD